MISWSTYFTAIGNILWPFGIFCGIFSPVLVFCSKKEKSGNPGKQAGARSTLAGRAGEAAAYAAAVEETRRRPLRGSGGGRRNSSAGKKNRPIGCRDFSGHAPQRPPKQGAGERVSERETGERWRRKFFFDLFLMPLQRNGSRVARFFLVQHTKTEKYTK
jgi:hypothetical protein